MLALKDPSLFKQQCYLNGEWISGTDTTEVTNPATGEVIGHVPKLGQAEATQAIADANAAWPAWRKKTAKERATILKKWFDRMISNADDVALIMTSEQGKPLAEARG